MKLYEVLSPDGLYNAVLAFLFGTGPVSHPDLAIYKYVEERFGIHQNLTQSICVRLLRTKNLPEDMKKRLRGGAVPAGEKYWKDINQVTDDIDGLTEEELIKYRQAYAQLYKLFIRALASKGIV